MIRFATDKDIPILKKMWNEIFGDEYQYIDMFFDKVFAKENTLVYERNGVAAMLYMVEYLYKNNGKIHKGVYLYALATRKEYRGQGIMSLMIEYATNICKSRDYDFMFLIPAKDSLIKYYENKGFELFKYIEDGNVSNGYSYEKIDYENIFVNNGIVLTDEQLEFQKQLASVENLELYAIYKNEELVNYRLCSIEEIACGRVKIDYSIMFKYIKKCNFEKDNVISLLLV